MDNEHRVVEIIRSTNKCQRCFKPPRRSTWAYLKQAFGRIEINIRKRLIWSIGVPDTATEIWAKGLYFYIGKPGKWRINRHSLPAGFSSHKAVSVLKATGALWKLAFRR